MKLQLITVLLVVMASGTWKLSAQATALDSLLWSVEQNNSLLAALRQQSEAEKAGNRTGLNPENPEMEYQYFWGNRAAGSNRTNYSLSQSFDFPTAYHHKRKVATAKNQQAELKYQLERNALMLEAKLLYIDIVCQRALVAEKNNQLEQMQQLTEAIQKSFDKGQASVLDLNTAKLNLLQFRKEVNLFTIEQERLLSELHRINGNQAIAITSTVLPATNLYADFEQWYEEVHHRNMELKYWGAETAISRASEKLQRSMNLPKLSTGYVAENMAAEKLQGIMVGISIPLWGNKNTVKQIKAQTVAAQAVERDEEIRYYNETQSHYNRAKQLMLMLEDSKEIFQSANNTQLLKKAFDLGEISLINYLKELSSYYEIASHIIETEKEYHRTVAVLNQWL